MSGVVDVKVAVGLLSRVGPVELSVGGVDTVDAEKDGGTGSKEWGCGECAVGASLDIYGPLGTMLVRIM